MPKPSTVFIGHQGINLPHGLTLPNVPKESVERCKSMIRRRYTLYEVRGKGAPQQLDTTQTYWPISVGKSAPGFYAVHAKETLTKPLHGLECSASLFKKLSKRKFLSD